MYVVLCWAFNLPALIASVYSLVQAEDCVRNLKALLLGNAIFSFVHAGFALYLQTRLFHGLQKAAEGLAQPPTAKEQMKRAWDIILYDFGFLFYLFVFFGSFGFNCYASGWAFSCGADFLAFLPSLLLILFFLAAMQFAVLWFFVLSCTDCCQSSPIARVVLGVKPSHPSQTAPPTVVGQPVVGKPAGPPQQQMPGASPAQAMYEKPSAGQQAAQTAAAGAAVAFDMGKAGLKKVGGWLQKK